MDPVDPVDSVEPETPTLDKIDPDEIREFKPMNHGLEAQSPWLTQFLSQQPKHVTVAAWTVQHKYVLL